MLAITFGKTGIVVFFVMVIFSTSARSDCNPRDFIDALSINQSGETEIAFVLSSTKQEFDKAKENWSGGGSYGLISADADWAKAKERAQSIASSTKFDYKNNYALQYSSQTLSGDALRGYADCLRAQTTNTPGLVLWLDRREGDIATFNVRWVGSDTKQVIGNFTEQPTADTGTIVNKPATLQKGVDAEIAVRRDRNQDLYLKLAVEGVPKSIVLVKDPPLVTWKTKTVVAPAKTSSYTTDENNCQTVENKSCISVTEPGGQFVKDSAVMDQHVSNDPSRYKETFTYLPERICVKVSQGTSGCNHRRRSSGLLTATERYPVAE